MTQTAASVPEFQLDAVHLQALTDRLASVFAAAHPYPHVVVDDFFPETVALAAANAFPPPDAESWHRYRDSRELKLMASVDAAMPPVIRQVIRELNSAAAISFLERVTGIAGLIPDPHLLGGGMHQTEPGGYLRVHADFNRHPVLNLDRRLNLIVYLNPGWREEYGGALELWDRTMSESRVRVLPVLNRCVIFATTSWSFHGHPYPLSCPAGTTRRSIALYYYTNGRPASELVMREHSTRFRRSPGETRRRDLAEVRGRAKDMAQLALPPAVVLAARRLRRALSR